MVVYKLYRLMALYYTCLCVTLNEYMQIFTLS